MKLSRAELQEAIPIVHFLFRLPAAPIPASKRPLLEAVVAAMEEDGAPDDAIVREWLESRLRRTPRGP